MIYQFKQLARIPEGVTAEAVIEERAEIAKTYGKASLERSTDAVLSEPEKFPNLRAFAPTDPEEALKKCVRDGIRYAYSNVVVVRQENGVSSSSKSRPVRVLFPVHDEEGDVVYERVDVIKAQPLQKQELIHTLRRDAQIFADRLQDVLAEVAESI